MGAFFSEDIFAEILKRLPISSLIKSMSVQKSWYHLIRSTYFNTLYSQYHQKNTYILFHSRENHHRISLRVNDEQCNQYISLPYPEDIIIGAGDGFMAISGISNGLLCLCHSKFQKVYLWNPIIRKCRTLPDPPLLSDDLPCRRFEASSAFGYLPENNDYKVIYIIRYHDKPRSNFVYVYVYSLSTNSWKTVEKDNFAGFNWIEEGSVVVNGAAYWVGMNDKLMEVIVCFDTKSEIIRDIMLPPQCSLDIEDFHFTLAQKSSYLSFLYTDYCEGLLQEIYT